MTTEEKAMMFDMMMALYKGDFRPGLNGPDEVSPEANDEQDEQHEETIEKVYSLPEMVDLLGGVLSYGQLSRLIKTKKIPAANIGNKYFVTLPNVKKFLSGGKVAG